MRKTGSLRIAPLQPSEDAAIVELVNKEMPFEHIFEESATNTDIFEEVVLPICNDCLENQSNSIVFLYGGAQSGKSFTLFGGKGTEIHTVINNEPVTISKQEGVIALCIKYFRQYQQKYPEISHLTVSAVEIYGKTKVSANMKLFDLYDPHNLSSTAGNKPMNGRFTFDKLSKRIIEKYSVKEILETIQKAAHTVKTEGHASSNRGSIVFVLEIHFINGNHGKMLFVDPASNEINVSEENQSNQTLRKGENASISMELSQYQLLLINIQNDAENFINNMKRFPSATHGITNIIGRFLKENKNNFPKHIKLYTISPSITNKETTENTLATAFMIKEGFSNVNNAQRLSRQSIMDSLEQQRDSFKLKVNELLNERKVIEEEKEAFEAAQDIYINRISIEQKDELYENADTKMLQETTNSEKQRESFDKQNSQKELHPDPEDIRISEILMESYQLQMKQASKDNNDFTIKSTTDIYEFSPDIASTKSFRISLYNFFTHYSNTMLLLLFGIGTFVYLNSTEKVHAHLVEETYKWWDIPPWVILLPFYLGLIIMIFYFGGNLGHWIETHLLSVTTSFIINIFGRLLENIFNQIDLQQIYLQIPKYLQSTSTVFKVMINIIVCILYSICCKIMDTFYNVDTICCPSCGISKSIKGKSLNQWRGHIQAMHRWNCKDCTLRFTLKSDLVQHIHRRHPFHAATLCHHSIISGDMSCNQNRYNRY